MNQHAELSFPMSRKQAEICKQVLEVDKELKDIITREFIVEEDQLIVHFRSSSLKMLRTSINSFLELFQLTVQTIEEFGH
jgi:tRNA threonylcarbamoyladenosine modification (KEOPS) complex  Pcc1 subunit